MSRGGSGGAKECVCKGGEVERVDMGDGRWSTGSKGLEGGRGGRAGSDTGIRAGNGGADVFCTLSLFNGDAYVWLDDGGGLVITAALTGSDEQMA